MCSALPYFLNILWSHSDANKRFWSHLWTAWSLIYFLNYAYYDIYPTVKFIASPFKAATSHLNFPALFEESKQVNNQTLYLKFKISDAQWLFGLKKDSFHY